MLGWVATITAGALVLILCWYSISGDRTFDDQKTALDLAIAAVVLTGLSGAAALVSGRRMLALRRRVVLSERPDIRIVKPGAQSVAVEAGAGPLVAGAGLTHYHRLGCQMAIGRDWPEAALTTHEQEGRRPCGVCRP
jgi:hypothetical protein